MWERESVAARADRLTGVVWDVDAAAVVGRPYWLVWSMWTIQATAMSSSFVAVIVGVVIVGVVVVGVVAVVVVAVGVVVVGVVIVVCRLSLSLSSVVASRPLALTQWLETE